MTMIHGIPAWYVADLARLKELHEEIKGLRSDLELLAENLKELFKTPLGVQDGTRGEGG